MLNNTVSDGSAMLLKYNGTGEFITRKYILELIAKMVTETTKPYKVHYKLNGDIQADFACQHDKEVISFEAIMLTPIIYW